MNVYHISGPILSVLLVLVPLIHITTLCNGTNVTFVLNTRKINTEGYNNLPKVIYLISGKLGFEPRIWLLSLFS